MAWTDRWFEMANLVASGWNGFPRCVDDNIKERHERPLKYKFTEHSERNAIYNAAANGHSTRGSTMYLMWYPCCDCARAIIQSGISKVICVEPDWNDLTYKEDFLITKTMLQEANIDVIFIDKYKAPTRNESISSI